jgi:dihydroorotase/N-acyl-D-amino-acid deacylase
MKKLLATLSIFALLLVSQPLPIEAQTEAYDLIIMNGRIVDGSGNPWFYGDVAIRGDRIIKVGRVAAARAKRRLDARGKIVAPGFIDMLGQSEMNLLIDPQAQSKIYQGITTEITGEGGSIAPLTDYIIKEMQPTLDHYNLKADWRTLDEYFKRLERSKSAINLATYVGATQVRQAVLKDENRPPTPAELEQMKQLVAQAMEDGAVGISTSLVYAPAFYAKTEELIELAKVASRYGGVYASHMRNESNAIMAALDEAIRIGKEANIPVEIFHLKMGGKSNWGRMSEVLRKIEAARAEGLDITADQYPYIAGATALSASIPPWAHADGNAKFMERLKDPAIRQRLKKEMQTITTEWENFYLGVGGGSGILISSVLNPELKKYEGKRINEIAKMMNKTDEIDALFDLVIADQNQVGAIYFMMNEDDMRLALRKPWVSVGVDYGTTALTGPLAEGKAHPRAFGSYPRILGRYVRDEKILTLEEAIRKMTSLAANRFHFNDRGLIKPGFFADIVIFDPQKINDVATFEDPNRLSVGMNYVMVNGIPVLENGRLTGALPGRPLRGIGYKAKP